MADPVVCADGITYEREAITLWMNSQNVSPVTQQPLFNKDLTPNARLRAAILTFQQQQAQPCPPLPPPPPPPLLAARPFSLSLPVLLAPLPHTIVMSTPDCPKVRHRDAICLPQQLPPKTDQQWQQLNTGTVGCLPIGSALITGSGKLSASGIKVIVHAVPANNGHHVGPLFDPTLQSVHSSLCCSLHLARNHGHTKVAVPFIGSGTLDRLQGGDDFHKKQSLAAEIVKAFTQQCNYGLEVYLVVDDSDIHHFTKALAGHHIAGLHILGGSILDPSLPGLSACTCIVNDASSIAQGVSKAIGDAAGFEGILAEAKELIRKFHANVDAWLQGSDEAAAAAAAVKPDCPYGDHCLHLVQKGKWDKLPQALKDTCECHKGRHTQQQMDAATQAHAGGVAAAANTPGKHARVVDSSVELRASALEQTHGRLSPQFCSAVFMLRSAVSMFASMAAQLQLPRTQHDVLSALRCSSMCVYEVGGGVAGGERVRGMGGGGVGLLALRMTATGGACGRDVQRLMMCVVRRVAAVNAAATLEGALLSNVLLEGRLYVPVDLNRAFALALAGAGMGCAHSKGVLGRCYNGGFGVSEDRAKGLGLGRVSAAAGSCMGQFAVGKCYYEGWGVEQDHAEAVRLWRLAAAQGHATAQINLGIMFMYGRGVARNLAEAERLYRLAAAQGHATAQFCLGEMIYRGQGVAQDLAGWGVVQDFTEAARLYRLAAAQGHARAQYNLGFMFHWGQGFAQDRGEAIRWYRLAAAQGDADATEALERLGA